MDPNTPKINGYSAVDAGAPENTKVTDCTWSISPITQQVKISFEVSSSQHEPDFYDANTNGMSVWLSKNWASVDPLTTSTDTPAGYEDMIKGEWIWSTDSGAT